MKPRAETSYLDRGFTLLEIIITILVGSILATLMFQFMGSALTGSSVPVEIVRDSAATEKLMEEIISAYVKEINTNVVDPLPKIVTNYGSRNNVTMWYITFDASGAESTKPDPLPGPETNTLKVTVQTAGHSLVTLLTNSRAQADDPISKF
jgi:prepilin-type N-terminal cleavage/methylation domain-containing protein